jgi:hypothetical protein
MTNKDTVYTYGRGVYLCFIYGDAKSLYGKGDSIALNSNKYFNWSGRLPEDLRPIGQRCILQWQ